MKYILLILALMFAFPVIAQDATRTPTVSEQLTTELAKMSDADKEKALKTLRSGDSDAASSAREWVDIGNGLGEGLAATAQKMGVVANEFAQSPVGKMAMLLIIWNYMGDDISGWICGIMLTLIGVPLWMYQFRKTFGIYSDAGKFIKYDVKAMVTNDTNAMTVVYVFSAIVLFLAIILFIA